MNIGEGSAIALDAIEEIAKSEIREGNNGFVETEIANCINLLCDKK
jgi:hypothetical protein